MSVLNYITIAFAVVITAIYYKIREQLNIASKEITEIKTMRNNIEIVMQPKWFLYSIFLIALIWTFLVYNIYQTKGWWSIIYATAFYLSSGIAAYIFPIPSKKSIIRMFHRTVEKRIKEQHKYNSVDMWFVNKVYDHLEN